MRTKNLSQIKSAMMDEIAYFETKQQHDLVAKFCLLAKFAGWKYGSPSEEVTYDRANACLSSCINSICERIRNLTEFNLDSDSHVMSSSTGRFNVCMKYWRDSESVQFNVTIDIS